MDVDVFAAAHQADWARLDELVRRRHRLSGEEVDELVAAYQRTATQLSVLRSAGGDPALVARLSARVARARAAAVGGAHASGWRSVGRFFAVTFPLMAYRVRWWWLGTAAGSLLVAFLVGWWMARSPAVLASLAPRPLQISYLHQFRAYYSQYNGQSFGSEVWTHNATLAAAALVSGIFLGIPTLLFLWSNAAEIGVAGGILVAHGRAAEFFTLILPHGMLELSAFFLAASVGLRLGWTIIDPGALPRGQAMAEQGRAAMAVALGLILVLLVSGSIEAFVTPSALPAWVRILIGGCVAAAFLGYVLVLGRRATAAGLSADIEDAPDLVPAAG
ncbi:MAG: stage II sporulation protein M [Streptosporangiaceae bacterium]